jgi:hypothetical protein
MTRSAAVFAVLAAMVAEAPAAPRDAEPPVNLTEKATIEDRVKSVLELDLKGELLFQVDGKRESVGLEAKAKHVFTERVLAVTEGLPSSTARAYDEAAATAVVAGEKVTHALSRNRRLIVARRNGDGLLCFCPAGPLTRDELDLVTEHFNPQCLPGLLPGKAVAVGESWSLTHAAVQTACLLDAVLKSNLTGKLTAVKDGTATFTIEGAVEGIEHGAKTSMLVSAAGLFDITSGRIIGLTWKQKDEREQGPVNPASKIDATITLRREALAESPKELADEALARVPEGEPPSEMTNLRHTDAKGRYTLHHSRDWHITGQTDTHLVLRLLDRGEFTAQATVSVWKKAQAGMHTPVEEFKRAIANAPGWVQTKLLNEGELPTAAGHWLFRLTAEGKMDDLVVTQTFYLMAGPHGDQIGVTVATKQDRVKALGSRDLELVKGLEFGKEK